MRRNQLCKELGGGSPGGGGLCEKTQKTPEKTDAVGHPTPWSFCSLLPEAEAFGGPDPQGKAKTTQTLWSTGNHNL